MVQSSTLDRPRERTLGKGAHTRQRILDAAQTSVLQKGFAATSIDELLFEAGITKSGFFYHFRDKNDLARAMLERFQTEDAQLYEEIFARAEQLNEDPLHSYLVALKLLAETMADLPNGHPGCLVATFVNQDQLFDAGVRAMMVQTVNNWRDTFLRRLQRIADVYPPKVDIDLKVLADMLGCVVDGGIVMSKALRTPQVLADQIMAYRTFVRVVFMGV
jgi:TetR/AcrR family transcriptional regulator, transcriptional repressor for nem operon